MVYSAYTPEWLRYFIKRPMQGLLLATATFLFFVALIMFLDDVREIKESHISIEDGASIIKYTTNSLLVIVLTAVIFFFVGVLYTVEHGVFGPYIAWVVIAVGLILLMIASIEKDVEAKLIFSNAGWVAFSAGFGFFAGVNIEKLRNSPKQDDDNDEDESGRDAGSATGASREGRGGGKRRNRAIRR